MKQDMKKLNLLYSDVMEKLKELDRKLYKEEIETEMYDVLVRAYAHQFIEDVFPLLLETEEERLLLIGDRA